MRYSDVIRLKGGPTGIHVLALCVALAALLPACVSTRPFDHELPEFQSWYRRALAHPEGAPAFRQFHDAWRGDEAALRAYFTEAWRHMHAAYIDVEAGEALSSTLGVLIRRVGDDAFASALERERPEARSAVAASVHVPAFKSFPRTYKLLIDAPKIDFPLPKLDREG